MSCKLLLWLSTVLIKKFSLISFENLKGLNLRKITTNLKKTHAYYFSFVQQEDFHLAESWLREKVQYC